MRYVVALVAALTLNAAANLLMKIGMNSVREGGGLLQNGWPAAILTVLGSKTLVIGLICFAANAAFYMYALQSSALKISIAYPVMVGGGFALIAVVARFHPALAETLTWKQATGVGLVLLGIILIASERSLAAS